jgi:hypothetical protein
MPSGERNKKKESEHFGSVHTRQYHTNIGDMQSNLRTHTGDFQIIFMFIHINQILLSQAKFLFIMWRRQPYP